MRWMLPGPALPTAMALAAGLLWWMPAAAQIPQHCASLRDPAERFRCAGLQRPPPANPFGPGCSSQSDPAARLECLRRAQVGRMPAPAQRPQAQRCTPATPCSDRGGRYYLTPFGEKRYLQ
ncbi:hypothetical protein G3576_18710 [Roseomonas stagni]|uniref:Uncharacterized protein n=1 Tax=Falsiroseomonas algicola TaxID=2716930 RepID=A0A6M1LPJ0_9PROT|nr:hypothetical protein [Falsiroseomonas algicola]NGM22063.1 hypothetical protein [Falsiroseomonas algicola]